jgi:hypothetical protein
MTKELISKGFRLHYPVPRRSAEDVARGILIAAIGAVAFVANTSAYRASIQNAEKRLAVVPRRL